jgi:hypothetical protein
MTNTNVGPLRLAVGSHKAGSGRGCAMNVISWENGDSRISDMPDCTHPFLSRVVQRLNDSICEQRDGGLLCADCSVIVLGLAHRTVGTADADPDGRVMVRIAAEEAQRVAHMNSDPRVQAAIDAALAWADTPTAAAAAAANAAAAAPPPPPTPPPRAAAAARRLRRLRRRAPSKRAAAYAAARRLRRLRRRRRPPTPPPGGSSKPNASSTDSGRSPATTPPHPTRPSPPRPSPACSR